MAFFDLRRLFLQDFEKKYEDLMGKLAPIINNSFEQIQNAFNNGLTVKANLAAQEIDIEVTAPVNPEKPLLFKSTLKGPAKTVFVGNVQVLRGTAATGYPMPTWQNFNNQIKITNFTNLTDGSKYLITLHVYQ